MTQDKSNHFVLITVSLILLISIAVPTSMCFQLLGITLCSEVSTALVSSSAVVFIPPPLIELSGFSSSIANLFSMQFPASSHQPHSPASASSPSLPIKPAAQLFLLLSGCSSPLKSTFTQAQPHLDQTLVPLHISLQNWANTLCFSPLPPARLFTVWHRSCKADTVLFHSFWVRIAWETPHDTEPGLCGRVRRGRAAGLTSQAHLPPCKWRLTL